MTKRLIENQPIFNNVGVIGLVPDRWNSVWMVRHHVLSRLAKYFHIAWVNPAEEWRKFCKIDNLFKKRIDDNYKYTGFRVYNHSIFLSKIYKPGILSKYFNKLRIINAKRMLTKNGVEKIVLYIWRPEFAEILHKIEHDVSCYHIDDEYSFSTDEKPIDNNERHLIESVNQVIIHSPALLEKKGEINPNTAFLTNGVDYPAYSVLKKEPDDLKHIQHPRIGYVGMIKGQLNIDLLLQLAKLLDRYSFVFVGPVNKNSMTEEQVKSIEELKSLHNVYFLGYKPVDDLSSYMQHLDICMLPYQLNNYTKYIYPMKLHEYLATGRPVIGTPIRSLQEFSRIIPLATSVEDWLTTINLLLQKHTNSEAEINKRKSIAKEYDWDNITYKIAEVFCSQLGKEYVSKLNLMAT